MNSGSAGRLLCVLLLGACLVWPTASHAACVDPPGDLTADLVSDVVDVQCGVIVALWELSATPGLPPNCVPAGVASADLNCDQTVTVTDILLVIQHALGAELSSAVDANADGCVDSCAPGLLCNGTSLCATRWGGYNAHYKYTDQTTHLDDVAAVEAALTDSHHNFYGVRVDDGTAWDDTSGYYWKQLITVLEQTAGSGIEVFAVTPEKHQATTNRWDFDWVAAAEELSHLSLSYPHLVGFTVDDFSGYVCNSGTTDLKQDECYDVAYLSAITEAAHSHNPDFEFWPTVYYDGAAKMVHDGHALGSAYGVKMWDGDYAKVTFSFSLSQAPNTAQLTFLYIDDSDIEDPATIGSFEVYKTLDVNGAEVFSDLIWYDQYVERFDDDVSEWLVWDPAGADNQFSVTLAPDGNVNAYKTKMLYVWDVQLRINGEPVALDVSYHKQTSDKSWEYIKQETSYLYESNDPLVVAESTSAYSIVDAVDGILAPYRIASADYNAEIFPHQLSTTRQALAGKRLYAVQYGGQWGVETVPAVLAEQVEVAGSYADGVLLFNFPLQMYAYGTQQGLFGEKASPNSNFSFFGFYPGYQSGTPGWYQSWTSATPLTGEWQISVYDNRTNASGDYFLKEVFALETGEVFYSDTLSDDLGVETVTVSLGEVETTLVLRMSELLGVGNWPAQVFFDVMDAAGAGVDPEGWVFGSGADSVPLEVYQILRDVFESWM